MFSYPLPMIPPDSFAPRKTLLSVPTVKLASGGAQLISAPAGILIKRNNLRNMGQGEERVWRGGKEEHKSGYHLQCSWSYEMCNLIFLLHILIK